MNKTDGIQKAVEKITGKKFDTLIVLGLNETGYTLTAGKGDTSAIAVLLTSLYKKFPQLEAMVETAKLLNKTPKEGIDALFEALGGKEND